MTVLIAPDSFKGSLTACEAAFAIEKGVKEALPDAATILHPISDGGEGLVQVVTPVMGGTLVRTDVSGPLPGQRISAQWGVSADRSVAILEMAGAAGLPLVPIDQRNPKLTTTYGVGELMRAALDAGITSMIIGIGGSATNDGGAGMAEALGVRILDSAGNQVARGGAGLLDVESLDVTKKDPRLDRVRIQVACDVHNTLCGPAGASAIYGPQKGASPEDVKLLDRALHRFSSVIKRDLGLDLLELPGGGAAGGLGAGLVAFCGASLKPGIDLVLRVTGFDDRLAGADLVITGEGKIDEQVKFGKALAGVIDASRKRRVPVLAAVGDVEGQRGAFVNDDFLAGLESLTNETTPGEVAMNNASALLTERTKLLLQRYFNRT